MKKRMLPLPAILCTLSIVFLPFMGLTSLANKNTPHGSAIHSNVPLNEIKVRAYRHFRKNFPAISDETWFKYDQGYLVSFVINSWRNQVHYDTRGFFLYSVKYYTGAAIDRETGSMIKKKFPDYQIDVVTEINNGEKTFYLVIIKNPAFVKTISICEGTVGIIKEFINGA
jgi:hypothetical protein